MTLDNATYTEQRKAIAAITEQYVGLVIAECGVAESDERCDNCGDYRPAIAGLCNRCRNV